jgi:hypothetical protein
MTFNIEQSHSECWRIGFEFGWAPVSEGLIASYKELKKRKIKDWWIGIHLGHMFYELQWYPR